MQPLRRPNRFLERRKAKRIAAFVLSDFPRADQEPIYLHLQRLALSLDVDLRIFYEECVDPVGIDTSVKAWLGQGFVATRSPLQQAADLDHFRQVGSDRLDGALARIAHALDCTRAEVEALPATGRAWSSLRWTKAYAPDLVASFYTLEDGLVAYLACALLDLPRLLFLSELGDSSTHFLAKLMPLHVHQADLVVVHTRPVAVALAERFGDAVAAKVVCVEGDDEWESEVARRTRAVLRRRRPATGREDLGPVAAFRTGVQATSCAGIRPFVLLSAERTGSNLLTELLQSHPNVQSAGELFNPGQIEAGVLDMPLVDAAELPAMLELRRRDPAALHADFLQRACNVGCHAAGFKLMYYHAAVDNRVVDHLLGLRDLHVVHLVREDRLARWISMMHAVQSGSWWAPIGAAKATRESVELKPRETIMALESDELLEERFRATFADRRMHVVTYEQLASDLQGTAAQVLDFLGVDVRPLHAQSVKTGERDPRVTVRNWRELTAALRDTRWEDAVSRE